MRAQKLLVLCALVPVAALSTACGSDSVNSASKPASTKITTTTTAAVDRPAVDALIDRIIGPYKPVTKAESGDIPGRDLTQSATALGALSDELKDPAKRPRGVPAPVVDELVAALAGMVPVTVELARNVGACTGASNPRCAELYIRANQAQTGLNNALFKLADFGTRTRQDVQNLLYS